MWIVVLVAVIGSFPATLAAVLAFLSARKHNAKLDEIHVIINSRFSNYLALTARTARARGVEEGRRMPRPTPNRKKRFRR